RRFRKSRALPRTPWKDPAHRSPPSAYALQVHSWRYAHLDPVAPDEHVRESGPTAPAGRESAALLRRASQPPASGSKSLTHSSVGACLDKLAAKTPTASSARH